MNVTRLSELRQEVGADALDEVVAMYLEETDAATDRLRAGASAVSAEDLHFLKGAALTVGLDDLAGRCARAETGEGPVHEVLDVYPTARTELIDALNAMNAE